MNSDKEQFALETTIELLERNCSEEFLYTKLQRDFTSKQSRVILQKALDLNECQKQIIAEHNKLSIFKKIKYFFRNNTVY